MFNTELKQLWGFHPTQEAYFNTLKENNNRLVPARVVFSSHDQYKILFIGMADEKQARLRGSIYHSGEELPVVGDWVAAELLPGNHQFLPIEATLPRKSRLKRSDESRSHQTLVANVDVIALVTSFNQDLNLRRLERGLAMVEDSGAAPIIILNKSDLIEDSAAQTQMQEISKRFGDVAVIPCSAQSGHGVNAIKKLLKPGQSIAFLGMSGVGKSTLINAMIEKDRLATSEIRQSDSRGRHTTTHREIVPTAEGFWVIDTPGIREFSFAGEEAALENTFEDVVSLMKDCRFGNCSHLSEPGCRIQGALENGELALDRWKNFLKMKRELNFQATKDNKAYRSQKRKEFAKRSLNLRKELKAKKRI